MKGRNGAPALGKAGQRVEGFANTWRAIRSALMHGSSPWLSSLTKPSREELEEGMEESGEDPEMLSSRRWHTALRSCCLPKLRSLEMSKSCF